MKYQMALFWLIVFTGVSGEVCFSQPTGLWVAQKIDARETSKDASLEMAMTLVDKRGEERHRNLFVIRKDFNGDDRLLLKFTYPADINGTAFLVWEHKSKENERFLYLPALGRIRRIATLEKNENFAGTDFSYEDISGRRLEDYHYELIKEDTIYEEENCYLLAFYPKEKGLQYPKILALVRKDNFVIVKVDYYNKKDELEKTYRAIKLDKIDGIWTVLEHSMENLKTQHKTLIEVKEVRYNKGIPNNRFERKALEK